MTIINLEFRRSFCECVPLTIQVSNAHDVFKSLCAHGASIHAQAAANGPRNSFHPFKTAQTCGLARISDLLEFGADSRCNLVSGNIYPVKLTAARMDHHAANPSIADKQV